MQDIRIYWIWLAERAGQGSKLAVKLINFYGNAANVYSATPEEIEENMKAELTARDIEAAKKILSDKSLDRAVSILEEANRLGQRVLVPTDSAFPKSLINLRDAPMVLYVLGILPKVNKNLCISVVGTRTMSDIGRNNAFAMGYGLAAGGAVVVSGMALGADGMALSGAVTAGGSTIAVLGGGADVIYPKDHENLYYNILSHGAIISEYPPGTKPCGYHFPVRNRLISGISAGTVVVEADLKSGALITARHAIYQGKNVFAMPGEIGKSGSEGTNKLIKDGVLVAISAEDVLAEYEFVFPHCVSIRSMRRALKRIDVESAAADTMSRLRIVSRTGGNYYGKGSYGGRRVNRMSDEPKDNTQSVKSIKNERISMGDEAKNNLRGKNINPKELNYDKADILRAENISQRIDMDMLDEINIKVYNMMKPDVPMIPDELVTSEIPVSDVLSSLSLLELAGAVESGAGGYFLRRSSDDISFLEDE